MNYEGQLAGNSLNVAKPTVLYEVCQTSEDVKPPSSKFLLSLWEMLCDPNAQDDVSWSEDGSYFVITNARSFSEKVLPVYFKHNNLTSFTRQLYNYGFSRISALMKPDFLRMLGRRTHAKTEFLAFKHANFHRDHPEFLTNVRKRQQRSEGLSVWQTIFQINAKLDGICDRLNELGHRLNVLEAKQNASEKRYSGLWKIFNYAMSTALMSRGEGMANKQHAMLKFNPRLKLGQPNEELNLPPSMKKHRLDDMQTATLNGQTYLRVSPDDIPIVRRALLAYQPSTKEGSKCSLTYKIDQNQRQENPAPNENGCNALVVRSPRYAVMNSSLNIPENFYEQTAMPSLTDAPANGNSLFPDASQSTTGPDNTNPKNSAPFQGISQEPRDLAALDSSSLSQSECNSSLPKWPMDGSSNSLDFGNPADDPFLGMSDLFGLPLNMDELSTPKFPLDYEENEDGKVSSMTDSLFPGAASTSDASDLNVANSSLYTNADILGSEIPASSPSRSLFEQDFLADTGSSGDWNNPNGGSLVDPLLPSANYGTTPVGNGPASANTLLDGPSAQDYIAQPRYPGLNGQALAFNLKEGDLTTEVPTSRAANKQAVSCQAPTERRRSDPTPSSGKVYRLSIKPVKK